MDKRGLSKWRVQEKKDGMKKRNVETSIVVRFTHFMLVALVAYYGGRLGCVYQNWGSQGCY